MGAERPKRRFLVGAGLVVLSLIPAVQQARAIGAWELGALRFEEELVLELPIEFAGRRVEISDPMPRLRRYSEDAFPSRAGVLVDGKEVLAPVRTMVRPGRDDLGRYHSWIDAGIFRHRPSGVRTLYLARRVESPDTGERRYDVLILRPNQPVEVLSLSHAELPKNYPIMRTLQFLIDDDLSLYPFSFLEFMWVIYPVVPFVYPWLTLIVGATWSFRYGRRSRRSQPSAGQVGTPLGTV